MNQCTKIITSDTNDPNNLKNILENFDNQKSKQYNLNMNQIEFSLYNPKQNIPSNVSDFSYNKDMKSLFVQKTNDNALEAQKLSNNFFKPLNSLNQNFFPKNYILACLSDQKSTILLQRIIIEASHETIDNILSELKGIIRNIIKDRNGNYFCSDLFKVCEQNQRIQVLKELSPYLSKDCSNNFATHPIQTLIGNASCEIEYKLILNSFNNCNKFLDAALDPKGAYTMRKIIEHIPEKYRIEFNYIFTYFIEFISKKKFGIVVVKKFISCTQNRYIIYLIFNLVKNNFMDFAMDQYANYLIQFLLEKWKETPEGNEIKKIIRENFLMMSENKYSSFICEKFIKNITPEVKNDLIGDINVEEVNKSINPHFIKIMKALGVYNKPGNNVRNNENRNFL